MAGIFRQGSSEDVYLQGKVSWVKYITPDPMYNKWSVTLHPTPEALEKIRDLQAKGVKNVLKKDEDGDYYVAFSRPTERKIKGRSIGMTAPVVLNSDGVPLEGIPIGNGSTGTVKLEVYPHPTPTGGKAHAARWAGLKIDDLVPFNKETDYPDAVKSDAEGLNEQPQQIW